MTVMKGSAYPGSSGRSVDMIAIDPWPSLEQKYQEKMSQVSQCQWGPRCVLRPRQGSYKVGDGCGCGVGLFCKLLAVRLPDPWLVGTAFPSPLSQTAPGRAVVSIAYLSRWL